MNQASLKFYNICNTGTGFQDSFQTIIKDIVDVMAEKNQKRKSVANLSTSEESEPDTKKQVKIPPSAHNFKHTSDPNSPKYKVDDIKNWNGVIYYLCFWPTHKDKLKWHPHTVETCHTRKHCLESKNDNITSPSDYKSPDKANVSKKVTIITEPTHLATTTSDRTSTLTEVPNIDALLAAALGQLGDNQLDQEFISDALNVIT